MEIETNNALLKYLDNIWISCVTDNSLSVENDMCYFTNNNKLVFSTYINIKKDKIMYVHPHIWKEVGKIINSNNTKNISDEIQKYFKKHKKLENVIPFEKYIYENQGGTEDIFWVGELIKLKS